MPLTLPPPGAAGYAELPGAPRAAALLLLLGAEDGAPVRRMLEEDEIKKVSPVSSTHLPPHEPA
ncbi:hypothetical protein NS230_03860, partial [Methylobacterium indicum]